MAPHNPAAFRLQLRSTAKLPLQQANAQQRLNSAHRLQVPASHVEDDSRVPAAGPIFNCQLMVSDGLDLATEKMAGAVERLSANHDPETSARVDHLRATPNESLHREKLKQLHEQVMHPIGINVSRHRERPL